MDNPKRPTRTSRGGNYYDKATTPRLSSSQQQTKKRPQSLQAEASCDSIYELLEVPRSCDSTPQVKVKARQGAQRRPTNKLRAAYSSSSSSSLSGASSEFATPQASPRVSRLVHRKTTKTRSGGSSTDYEPVNLSYENFRDNPLLDSRKKNIICKQQAKSAATGSSSAGTMATKPKQIPPRTCLEPIPTPRTMGRRASTASSSRDPSREKGPPAREGGEEPHYKNPPKPVLAGGGNNVYAEPTYQLGRSGYGTTDRLKQGGGTGQEAHVQKTQIVKEKTLPQGSSSDRQLGNKINNQSISDSHNQSKDLSKKHSHNQTVPKVGNQPSKQSSNRSNSQSNKQSKNQVQSKKSQEDQSELPKLKQDKGKAQNGRQASETGPPLDKMVKEETQQQRHSPDSIQSRKGKPYDDEELNGTKKDTNLVEQIICVTHLPDNGLQPAVLLDKKPRIQQSMAEAQSQHTVAKAQSRQAVAEAQSEQTASSDWQPYVPLERKRLQPDWLEDLRLKEEAGEQSGQPPPRPKSIVDGVLYTSRALEAEAETSGGASYSLIAPEVFETYDVCRSPPKAVKVFCHGVMNINGDFFIY